MEAIALRCLRYNAAVGVERHFSRLYDGTHIVFFSMNGISPYNPTSENAYTAILSRIVWEMSGREKNFRLFAASYSEYGSVNLLLTHEANRVILIVDELNVIHHTTHKYLDMCYLLDNFVQQNGCAMLYSTHQCSTADLLRGQCQGAGNDLVLSKRQHHWMSLDVDSSNSECQLLAWDVAECYATTFFLVFCAAWSCASVTCFASEKCPWLRP